MSTYSNPIPSRRGVDGTEEAQPSYIAPDLVIRGRVSCASDLYVAGHIDGEMDCETLTVTAGGLVSGSINAGRLNMEAGGRLEGDLYADTMGIKGDAILTARILCRGTQGRGAPQERAPVERRKRDSLHALAHPLPAE